MSWTHERARVARLSQTRTTDDPDLVAARAALKAARLEEHVRKLVDSAPPLDEDTRARLAVLLRPTPSAAA